MNLPTENQCFGYFVEYKVPKHILNHCLKVRETTVFLAKRLQEAGININVEFVDRISFLHDIFKMAVIKQLTPDKYHNFEYSEEELLMREKLREKYPNMYESEIAFEVFKDEFPELALSLKNASDPKNLNKSWEELVVHYADWRIFQEKVVPLSKRLSYLKEKYPRGDGSWDRYEQVIKEDEKKIFSNLNFSAEKLAEVMKNGR